MTNKPIDFTSTTTIEAAYDWIFNDNPNIARLKRQATVKVCIRNLAWYFGDLFRCLNQSCNNITYSKDDDRELFSISIDKQPELSIMIYQDFYRFRHRDIEISYPYFIEDDPYNYRVRIISLNGQDKTTKGNYRYAGGYLIYKLNDIKTSIDLIRQKVV
jgi:hypothetical protein